MPKRGSRRIKNRTHVSTELTENDKTPKSFVVKQGKVSKETKELVKNTRSIMLPFTAKELKERKFNTVKDYIGAASIFGVTHLMSFTESNNNINLRIGNIPHGPTISLRVIAYSTVSQIKHLYSHPSDDLVKVLLIKQTPYHDPPLAILDNFSEENQYKLFKVTIQSLFQQINVHTIKIANCKRVALFHLDVTFTINRQRENDLIELRHYLIRPTTVGINKSIKKIFQSNKLPDIGEYEDIADYLYDNNNQSESEVELESEQVILPDDFSKVNTRGNKCAIKLIELGPRMSLRLIKVEKELMSGDLLYHRYMVKSEEEKDEMKSKILERNRLRQQRRKIQEQNVKKKEMIKAQKKAEKKKLMDKKKEKIMRAEDGNMSEDDDNEWFKQEVGEYPTESLVPVKRKRVEDNSGPKGWVRRKKFNKGK